MYIVPKNVGTRFEFIEGFGMKELLYCAVGGVVGLGISLFLGIFTSSLFKFIPLPFFVAATFMLVRVDPRLGSSLIQNMIGQYSFNSKTREYHYVYGEGRTP